MSYDELTEMEKARDGGDGRDDHRHMGRRMGHMPLNVAGIDSDANHKSSWYHYLKHKCLMSSNCPQRGCYDCPMFSEKGENPAFKERQALAKEVRMRDKSSRQNILQPVSNVKQQTKTTSTQQKKQSSLRQSSSGDSSTISKTKSDQSMTSSSSLSTLSMIFDNLILLYETVQ